MHVLFCGGNPKAPSWQMRGVQIASCDPNWLAVNEPSDTEIAAADVVVVVKRFKDKLIKRLRKPGKKIVWDALDFWPQNAGADLPQDLPGAIMLARGFYDRIRPDAVICANQQMAEDFRQFTPHARHIYHHARLDAAPLPFGKVAWYDGCEKHAEQMLIEAEEALRDKGWQLAIGKPEGKAGMLLGFRDQNQGTWLADRWKSNVKAANAIAYNLPLVAGDENGYTETIGRHNIFLGIGAAIHAIENGGAHDYSECESTTLQHAYEEYKTFLELV